MKDDIIKLLGAIISAIIFCAFLALPTMLIWNWVMPDIFGVIKLNFWHALGLNLLANILFQKGSAS